MPRKTYWYERIYELRDKLSFVQEAITLSEREAKLLLQLLYAGEGELYPTRKEIESQIPPLVREPASEHQATEKQTMFAKEVAAYLGVSYSKIHELVRGGAIPHFRIGNKMLFQKHTIDEWIQSQNLLRKKGGD